jgi:TRAP-type C4-dicarboxylate transport system substrate-binding protein
MVKITPLALVFLLLAMSGPAWPKDSKTLKFAVSEAATNVTHAYYQFAQKAYHELGYEIELKKYPENRMYAQADFDKVDGILISNKAILKKHTNLIAVPVVLTQADIIVLRINSV